MNLLAIRATNAGIVSIAREENHDAVSGDCPVVCRSHSACPSRPPSHKTRRLPPRLVEKLNAYVGCINRLSERSYESAPLLLMGDKTGPTGKERIIYGTYTIYDTSDCKKNVEKANARSRATPNSNLLLPLMPTPSASSSRC